MLPQASSILDDNLRKTDNPSGCVVSLDNDFGLRNRIFGIPNFIIVQILCLFCISAHCTVQLVRVVQCDRYRFTFGNLSVFAQRVYIGTAAVERDGNVAADLRFFLGIFSFSCCKNIWTRSDGATG